MPQPLVSVVIGTYRRVDVIRETLASVFAQSYQPLEIIVVDDDSDDGTLEVLRTYGDRIVLIERTENSGSADIPRWEAVEACSGQYVAFLDSDDLWDTDKIEKQVAAMDAHPEWGFSHHYVRRVDPCGEDLGIRHEGGLPASGDVALPLAKHCFVCTSSVMVKPAVWLQAQRREDLGGFGTEWDFFLSIARENPVGLVDEVLGSYRVDPESVSHSNWKRGPWDVLAMERLRKKKLYDGLLSQKEQRKQLFRSCLENAVYFRGHGYPDRSLWFWRKAFAYHPVSPGLWIEFVKLIGRTLKPA